jgi:hypothetical protein
LLLGLKGTMSEAELYVLREACWAEFATRRRAANCGGAFPWASSGAKKMARSSSILMKLSAPPSAQSFPASARISAPRLALDAHRGFAVSSATCYGGDIRWGRPELHRQLTNPVYAGAYAYGKSRHQVILDASGLRKKHVRRLPSVFLPDHHEGFIDWSTYEANCARIAANTHPRPHQAGGGAVREGTALLQGLAMCARCGRKVRTHYTGRTASPGYHRPGKTIANPDLAPWSSGHRRALQAAGRGGEHPQRLLLGRNPEPHPQIDAEVDLDLIRSRTRSRRPVSIGSNQSSKSWEETIVGGREWRAALADETSATAASPAATAERSTS